jgi:formylglycine-generating enzyme required for sulfatase activity
LLAIVAAPGPGGAQEAPGSTKLKELGITLVPIPGGTFSMGFPDGEDDEKPAHTVTLKGFLLGATEVTQAQWRAVMGTSPSSFKGCDACPVESVSWNDAQDFLGRLGKAAGATYRLPTEAEWEYAAGGGTAHTKWAGTADEAALGGFGWFADNSGDTTHPVAQKKPNGLGLYDMSGNVWEWCADWYGEKYYASSPAEAPPGPARGHARILRGGSWINSSNGLRVGMRHRVDPELQNVNLLGVRIAADAP